MNRVGVELKDDELDEPDHEVWCQKEQKEALLYIIVIIKEIQSRDKKSKYSPEKINTKTFQAKWLLLAEQIPGN